MCSSFAKRENKRADKFPCLASSHRENLGTTRIGTQEACWSKFCSVQHFPQRAWTQLTTPESPRHSTNLGSVQTRTQCPGNKGSPNMALGYRTALLGMRSLFDNSIATDWCTYDTISFTYCNYFILLFNNSMFTRSINISLLLEVQGLMPLEKSKRVITESAVTDENDNRQN